MEPSDRVKVAKVLAKLLDAISREAGKTREWLSLEIEQVTARALFEVFRLGSTARRRPAPSQSSVPPPSGPPSERPPPSDR
jgi:hypothetical protein